jgi:uncharacterized protein YjiS (DUF1127 family)
MAAPNCNRNRSSHGGNNAVTARLQSSSTNSLWENFTLKKHSSQNANQVVRLYNALNGRAARVVLSDDRGISRANLARAAWPDLPELNSCPAAMPKVTGADRPATAFWWSVFTFFMEGFAICGASMHPTAAFPVEAVLTAAKRPHPCSARRTPIAAEHERGPYLLSENGNVVELDRVAARNAGQPRRWNWLSSPCDPVVTLLTHWRREQEIKKAVAALVKLNDRTLRDMGIPHRSQIEQVVRYCRDC